MPKWLFSSSLVEPPILCIESAGRPAVTNRPKQPMEGTLQHPARPTVAFTEVSTGKVPGRLRSNVFLPLVQPIAKRQSNRDLRHQASSVGEGFPASAIACWAGLDKICTNFEPSLPWFVQCLQQLLV